MGQETPPAKINQPAKHSPQMGHICDATAAGRQRRNEGHHTKSDDKPLRRNRKDNENDSAIRKQNAVSRQYSVNRARGADRSARRIRREQYGQNAGADSADKEKFGELARSPESFEFRAKHPQPEHVEQNVEQLSGIVEKNIRDELPKIIVVGYQDRRQAELISKRRSACHAVEDLQKESDDTGNDQNSDGRSPTSDSKT